MASLLRCNGLSLSPLPPQPTRHPKFILPPTLNIKPPKPSRHFTVRAEVKETAATATTSDEKIREILRNRDYDKKFGFSVDIDSFSIPKGLSKETIRVISSLKEEPQWMLEFRLKAFEKFLSMKLPTWSDNTYPPIDFQNICYYSAPKKKPSLQSLDEADPELLRYFDKLGVPLNEQKRLANVAVDAVLDSVSIATTHRKTLEKAGVIFCSISEAIKEYPELVRKYLGRVVPSDDNYYAALNSAVFSDGSFCYIPKDTKCPMQISTYFRINALETGQFERTLIVADDRSAVEYLEGCTAPSYDRNQLHAAVVELYCGEGAEIKYSTVQNWYAGDENALTTSASTIPIELNSMSTAAMPTAAPMKGGRELELLRQRELEIEQRRVSSTSSGSSASSVDIDTYDEPTKVTMVPPIAERQLQDEMTIERIAPKMPPPSGTPAQDPIPSIEKSMKAAYIHDTDEDSDTSMGASDDEEERRISARKHNPLSSAQPRTTSRRPIDDNDEETKAQEFAETPALPPPSPSAHTATRTVLERPSIANSLAGLQLGDATHPESDSTHFVEVVAPNRTEAVEEDVVDHGHQLQHSKVEDLIDHDYQDSSAVKELNDRASEKSLGCDDDVNVDIVTRKYTQNSRDIQTTKLSQREDSFSESDDEVILNTVGCDMNYLDEDMRQFHDQSLFIRQSRDGGAPSLHGESKLSSQLRDGMPSGNSEVQSTSNVLPPYEHMPTSPKGESGKTVDFSKPSRPTISREGTFALDNMMSEERQKPVNDRAGGIVLDAQMAPSNVSSPSAVSTVRTDDRFATQFSAVSVPMNDAAEDLSFDLGQRDSEVPRASMIDLVEEDRTVDSPPPVIPVLMPADMTAVENSQSSGDNVLESRSRSSSKISFSSVLSSGARDSSICSMGLDAPTPPATPPSASPVGIDSLSATSASSPAAVPALDLATSSSSLTEVIIPAQSNTNAPAYLPDRFRTAEQLQQMQQQVPVNEKPSESTLSSTPSQVSNTPRQSAASSSALDNFQLDFSASFNAHQEKKSQKETTAIEGLSRASIIEDRNRASSTGSNDVQVRYQPAGSSVLDTVPDTGVPSSDEDDSEDENMLLSARQLYGRFGNTKQLSKLGGDRPGFQHTLSQIQQSFDELSSDSEDENTPATSDAIHRW